MYGGSISARIGDRTVSARIVYCGEFVCAAYYELDPFDEKIVELGVLLDEIERSYGRILAVIPNIGLTSTSILFGTSFQGVKGVAIVFRKKKD